MQTGAQAKLTRHKPSTSQPDRVASEYAFQLLKMLKITDRHTVHSYITVCNSMESLYKLAEMFANVNRRILSTMYIYCLSTE